MNTDKLEHVPGKKLNRTGELIDPIVKINAQMNRKIYFDKPEQVLTKINLKCANESNC